MDETRNPGMTITAARPSAVHPDPLLRRSDVDSTELMTTRHEGAATFHGLPDASAERALDLLVETLCELLEVDYAGVHLLDCETHRVAACTAEVPNPPVPRSDTLCGVLLDRHVLAASAAAGPGEIIEIGDTALDASLPTGAAAGYSVPVRFYTAAPLFDSDGAVLGTLCAIAHHPRSLTATERRTLLFLGLAASQLVARL